MSNRTSAHSSVIYRLDLVALLGVAYPPEHPLPHDEVPAADLGAAQALEPYFPRQTVGFQPQQLAQAF
jgi:hypothetical protein